MNANPIPCSVVAFLAAICRERVIHFWYALRVFVVLLRMTSALSFSFVIGRIVRVAQQMPSPTWTDFLPLVAIALCLRILAAFCLWMEDLAWLKARVPMEMNGYSFLFRHTINHSHNYFADHPAGKVAQKISELPWAAMQVFDAFFNKFLPSSAALLVFTPALFLLNPSLGLLVVVWLVPASYIVYRTALEHTKLSAARASTRGQVMGAVVDAISNNNSVRLFARNKHEISYLAAFIERHNKTTMRLMVHNRTVDLARDIPVSLLFAVLVGWGIKLYLDATIPLDRLATLLTICAIAVSYTESIVTGLINIVEYAGTIQEGLDLVSQPYDIREKHNADSLRVTQGVLTFDHVSFSYPDNKVSVLKDFDLVIPAGQKVGLIGKSGAGKSTLFGLVSRAHDASSGIIRIDGQDISSVTLESLCSQIAVIPQDTALFHRTLMENIRYGRIEASDDEVREAARLAHCEEFISKLPEGFNTWVGERGIKLSGGQRQRIAIARALLKNAPLLLLDEATSALDSESEQLIQASLAKLMQGRTVIAIAHRLSTIAHLDRLVVMADGAIVEDGSHKELLIRNGAYAELWRKQSGGFLTEESRPVLPMEQDEEVLPPPQVNLDLSFTAG